MSSSAIENWPLFYDIEGKIDAPASFQDKISVNTPNAQHNSPNSILGNNSHPEEFPGFASPNDVKHSGMKQLVWLLFTLIFLQIE